MKKTMLKTYTVDEVTDKAVLILKGNGFNISKLIREALIKKALESIENANSTVEQDFLTLIKNNKH